MKNQHNRSLADLYPPSESCTCEICRSYCIRPGWWTVSEAVLVIETGYGNRMMLEISPELTFGVLSPAFRGCEMNFALQEYRYQGCSFLFDGLCALYGTGLMPLECRFCHHTRQGMGQQCHKEIEKNWRSSQGRTLVKKWAEEYLKMDIQQIFSFTPYAAVVFKNWSIRKR